MESTEAMLVARRVVFWVGAVLPKHQAQLRGIGCGVGALGLRRERLITAALSSFRPFGSVPGVSTDFQPNRYARRLSKPSSPKALKVKLA